MSLLLHDGAIPRARNNMMKVLGVWLQTVGGSCDEMHRRICSMWKALAARRDILFNRSGSRRKRIQLCERAMRPVLMYSACNWHLALTRKKTLKATQLKVYHKLLGCFRVQGETREQYNRRTAYLARHEMRMVEARPWDEVAEQQRWNWLGHLARGNGLPTFRL